MDKPCGQKEVFSHVTIICKLVYNSLVTLETAFGLPTHHTTKLCFAIMCLVSLIHYWFVDCLLILVTAVLLVRLYNIIKVTTLLEYLNLAVYNSKGSVVVLLQSLLCQSHHCI